MLSEVINFIDSKLALIGYMPNSKGLIEKHKIEELNIPAEFCNGEWKAVDIETDFIYHRKIGSVSITELEEEQSTSCSPWQEKGYPMRLVFCIKKSNLNNSINDPESVGEDISNAIHTLNNKQLAISLKADTVQIIPLEINDNVYDAYDEEFGLTNYPIDYALLYVDYEIKITGSNSCFQNLCQKEQ